MADAPGEDARPLTTSELADSVGEELAGDAAADPASDASAESTPAGTSASVLRASALMGVGTVVSRLGGVVRGIMLAAALGAVVLADTFSLGNTLPNVVYILIIGGALNAVFIPELVRHMKDDGDEGRGYADRLHHPRRRRAARWLRSPRCSSPRGSSGSTPRTTRPSRPSSRRPSPVLPAADLLLRRLHDRRSGPQRARQLRTDDVGPGHQQHGRHRGGAAVHRVLPVRHGRRPTSLTPGASPCSAVGTRSASRCRRSCSSRFSPHRVPLSPALRLPRRGLGRRRRAGQAGPRCSCWSTSSPTSSSSTWRHANAAHAGRRRRLRPHVVQQRLPDLHPAALGHHGVGRHGPAAPDEPGRPTARTTRAFGPTSAGGCARCPRSSCRRRWR